MLWVLVLSDSDEVANRVGWKERLSLVIVLRLFRQTPSAAHRP
jgi:hypothetical protein